MIKRLLLIVLSSTVLFSTYALPILYTFEGNFYEVNSSIIDLNKEFDIIVDFDESGLFYNSPANDYTTAFSSYNYGSATFAEGTESFFSDVTVAFNGTVYETENALIDIWTFYGTEYFTNSVTFSYEDVSGLNAKFFSLENYEIDEGPFGIGDDFVLNEYTKENGSITNQASGNFILTGATPYNTQSVPEPYTIPMLASSMIFLSGIGFRRKKYR